MDGFHAEVDGSRRDFVFADKIDLVGDFTGFPVAAFWIGAAGVLSGPKVDFLFVDFGPPVEQSGECLWRLGDWPVELGAVVVAPAFFVPLEGIGI